MTPVFSYLSLMSSFISLFDNSSTRTFIFCPCQLVCVSTPPYPTNCCSMLDAFFSGPFIAKSPSNIATAKNCLITRHCGTQSVCVKKGAHTKALLFLLFNFFPSTSFSLLSFFNTTDSDNPQHRHTYRLQPCPSKQSPARPTTSPSFPPQDPQSL